MKIGIIGLGHLAKSFTKGLLNKDYLAEDINFADTSKDAIEYGKSLGLNNFSSNKDLVENSDVIVLAIRPNIYKEVLGEIKEVLDEKILISFLAGISLEKLGVELEDGAKIARVMPSIAMEVNESLTAVSPNENLTEEDIDSIKNIFDDLGHADITDEVQLELTTIVSGSGLGYGAEIISSMAKAARSLGYGDNSEEAIIQVFAGAIKLLQNSDISAQQMSDAVATEGGATIEGIKIMQEENISSIFTAAMQASYNKVK